MAFISYNSMKHLNKNNILKLYFLFYLKLTWGFQLTFVGYNSSLSQVVLRIPQDKDDAFYYHRVSAEK